ISGFGAAMAAASRQALGFGTAMREVSTLLSDTREMGRMTAEARAMAIQFGSLPTAQAQGFYQVISAGASNAAEAISTLDAANRLAIGGVTSVGVAADGLTTILNAYGDQVESVTAVSDAMFVAMRAGKTTIGELSSNIGSVAPLAAQTGIALEEVLAATAALTKGGNTTSVAMNGLSAVISSVIKPSGEAARMAKELGIDFSSAALRAKGLAGFLQDLADATGGAEEKLAVLFGGVEALRPVLALTGNQAGDFAQILDDMANKTGATADAFAKMSQDAQFKLNQLRAMLAVASVEVGDTLLSGIVPAAEAVVSNMDVIGDVAQAAAYGIGTLLVARTAGSAVTALSHAMAGQGGAILGLRMLSDLAPAAAARTLALGAAATTASLAMRGLGAAMAFMGGPVGVAITAVAAGAYLLATRHSQAEQAANQHRAAMTSFNAVIDQTKGKVEALNEGMAAQARRALEESRRLHQAVIAQQEQFARAGNFRIDRLAFDGQVAPETIEVLRGLQQMYLDNAIAADELFVALERLGQSDENLKPLVDWAAGWAGPLIEAKEKVQEAEASLARLNGTLNDTGAAGTTAAGGIGNVAAAAVGAIEGFDELLGKLRDANATYGLSEAAVLRYRLEQQALKAEQKSSVEELSEATRAQINEAVAIQAATDAKAQARDAASKLASAYQGLLRTLDPLEAAERERADALATLDQALRAGLVTEDQHRRMLGELNRQYQDNINLLRSRRSALEDTLDSVELENKALELTLAGRGEMIPLLRAEAELRRRLGRELLPQEAAELRRVYDEQIRLNRAIAAQEDAERAAQSALEERVRQANRAADEIVDYGTDVFDDWFAGQRRGWHAIWDDVVAMARRAMAQLAAEMVLRPIIAPVISGVMGGGLQATGSGQIIGGAGGMGGIGGMGIRDMTSLGSLLSGGGSSSMLYGAGQWLAQSSLGQAVGLSTTVGTPISLLPGSAGTATVAMTGAGQAFAQGLAASPWGIVGSMGAGLLGLGHSNPLVNAATGAAGSVAGGVAGSMMLAGSLGGPIGAIAGAFLGTALGGLFGGKKKADSAVTNVDLIGEELVAGRRRTAHGGNINVTNAMADA
ncbi:phage tail tape measure protein, partial [Telmatospirillum sp. J64-1]|uniref:phage tail tape measure protein n=1 Tax=Telmatospirillum sp. J64-1 TaxID=2502183 RepID=UPI00115E1E14